MPISRICVMNYFSARAKLFIPKKCSSEQHRTLDVLSNTSFRCCHSSQKKAPTIKYTAQILPDVERRLQSKEIKHRKHPGVRKQNVIEMPSTLIDAIDTVLSQFDQTSIMEDAKQLSQYIYKRRLPIEIEEVEARTAHALQQIDEKTGVKIKDGELSEETMGKLKKKINCELNRWKEIEYNSYVCVTYIVARMAANYAVVTKILSEIHHDFPSFAPKTFFDFGTGVGSAMWAAHSVFKKSIKEYFCVDASADMITLSQLLLQGGEKDKPMHIKNVFFRQFFPASNKFTYDLVVSAFSLMDLSSIEERLEVIDTLWQKTNDFLVIIENGSYSGYCTVLDARDYVLKLENVYATTVSDTSGAHVIAPCPHEMPCPQLTDASRIPCHFEVNYRPLCPDKDSLPVNTDTFSYIVLRRGHRQKSDIEQWPRIVKHIKPRSKHAHCQLCCSDGKLRDIVFTKGKHGRHAYRCARQGTLGDLLPVTVIPVNKIDCENESEDEYPLEDSDCNNTKNCVK